jgi:hypothetical protein
MRFRYLNRLASSSVFFTLISGTVFLTLAVAQYDETSLQYSVGDRARHTIYANETLRIQGEDTSKKSLAKAQRSIPPIYGYQKGFVRAQSRTMVDNWGETRESFLNSLDKVFGKRTFRNIEISAPPFKEFISVFQARNDGFPIDDNIARRWARGDGADEVIGGLVGEFESFMTSYFIVSDQALLSAPSELPNVDLISLSGSGPQNLVSLPNPTFVKLASQQLLSESEARKRFSELNSMYRSEAQKYVLQFVRPNTIYLEQLSLERWYGSSGSTKHETIFQKGEEIVVQGETITPVIKEALDLMIINLRFSRLRSSVQIELAKENKEGFEESPKTNSDQLAEPESKRESTPTLDSTAPLPKEDKKEGMLPPLLSPTTVAQTESLKENQSAAMLNSPAENALSADTGRDYRATSSTPSLVGSFYIWVIGIVLVAVVSALVILHFRSGPPRLPGRKFTGTVARRQAKFYQVSFVTAHPNSFQTEARAYKEQRVCHCSSGRHGKPIGPHATRNFR